MPGCGSWKTSCGKESSSLSIAFSQAKRAKRRLRPSRPILFLLSHPSPLRAQAPAAPAAPAAPSPAALAVARAWEAPPSWPSASRRAPRPRPLPALEAAPKAGLAWAPAPTAAWVAPASTSHFSIQYQFVFLHFPMTSRFSRLCQGGFGATLAVAPPFLASVATETFETVPIFAMSKAAAHDGTQNGWRPTAQVVRV